MNSIKLTKTEWQKINSWLEEYKEELYENFKASDNQEYEQTNIQIEKFINEVNNEFKSSNVIEVSENDIANIVSWMFDFCEELYENFKASQETDYLEERYEVDEAARKLQGKLNDLKIPPLTSLSTSSLNKVIDISQKILNDIENSDRDDWRSDADNNLRERNSANAIKLMSILGIETNKPYIKFKNLVNLKDVVYGDDEPFSDCGINKETLMKELDILISESQTVLDQKPTKSKKH